MVGRGQGGFSAESLYGGGYPFIVSGDDNLLDRRGLYPLIHVLNERLSLDLNQGFSW
jgi:hypothetical protein